MAFFWGGGVNNSSTKSWNCNARNRFNAVLKFEKMSVKWVLQLQDWNPIGNRVKEVIYYCIYIYNDKMEISGNNSWNQFQTLASWHPTNCELNLLLVMYQSPHIMISNIWRSYVKTSLHRGISQINPTRHDFKICNAWGCRSGIGRIGAPKPWVFFGIGEENRGFGFGNVRFFREKKLILVKTVKDFCWFKSSITICSSLFICFH